MIRFYILPIMRNVDNARGPMYFKWRGNPTGINCNWSMKDYGSVDMAVIAADILQADHDVLILNSDVYAFPENIDLVTTVQQRQALNTYIEAHAIPGDWLASGMTFREILRTITSMFFYLQRVLALIGYPIDPFAGLTLNTRYSDIPNPLHDALYDAAIQKGYVWNVGNNDQIRKIWKMMADQWGNDPIHFGIVTL